MVAVITTIPASATIQPPPCLIDDTSPWRQSLDLCATQCEMLRSCITTCLIHNAVNATCASCISALPSCATQFCLTPCQQVSSSTSSSSCNTCVVTSCATIVTKCLASDSTTMIVLPSLTNSTIAWTNAQAARRQDLDNGGIFLICVMFVSLLLGMIHGICYNRRYRILESRVMDEEELESY